MGNVFVHTIMSLDGFIADEVIARTGRVQRPGKRGLFDGRWCGPQFILTHTPPTDETESLTRLSFLQSVSWSTGVYEIPTIAPSGDCSLATV